jgi:hypothetical protein
MVFEFTDTPPDGADSRMYRAFYPYSRATARDVADAYLLLA